MKARTPGAVGKTLVMGAAGVLALVVLAPALVVIAEALKQGTAAYGRAVMEPDARSALGLTLLTAVIAVPLNTVFGIIAAWAIARHEFRGKQALLSLIDVPFAVSPVIAGMSFALLFGAQGLFGPWLRSHGWKIIFAPPGIVLATCFVTFPFVARELIPFMESLGREQEEAAASLGASGLQTFFRVTLPNIRWSVLYGVVLCNARAMGEFGAVSVVSGHIRGLTNTLPLQVEILYNEYSYAAAFTLASLLLLLALVTLFVKAILGERKDTAELDVTRAN